jgi:hypothetical protein
MSGPWITSSAAGRGRRREGFRAEPARFLEELAP